jgi:membrane glycosyltransferase
MDQPVDTLPPAAPLDMPVQSLETWTPATPVRARFTVQRQVILARVLVFSASALLTGLGTHEIYKVVSPAGITSLQVIFAALFAVTFAWIAFSCVSAVWGFAVLSFVGQRDAKLAEPEAMGRTAILMPVYNEDPVRVFATLRRMGFGLWQEGAGRHFDIIVLSDTRDDPLAVRELRAFHGLRAALGPVVSVYYRRRSNNWHRKAGNIADFVKRHGAAYDHMIVLDADSDMEPQTLITLARAMAADPDAGIIQTVPILRNRWSPFARMTQFAGRIYGPVIAAGLNSWHGRDGNYWGHNAIIRTRAFAAAAGLPELPGRKPFGGHILSHDFVEAALIRRAGYSVSMLPGLAGSYEETPPSLIDMAARDRRWAQGNLQHIKVVGAAGLHWMSRIHLIQGIMSYLASPLWLLLLVAGVSLTIIAGTTEPDYFPEGFSLFPAWPVFDPERAVNLLLLTALVLYLPKVLGVLHALMDRRVRKDCGGATGLLKSMVAEIILSMLLSPIMMMIQSRFVLDILRGRDSGWSSQNRDDAAQPFVTVLLRHASHVAAGLAVLIAGTMIGGDTILWFLPILLGLIGAPLLSWVTALPSAGVLLWRLNVFRIPEEKCPPLPIRKRGEAPQLQAAE